MKRARKKLPKFKSEDREAEFWSSHDSTDYVDYSGGRKTLFPNLKPSTRLISIRLPDALLHRLKSIANERDVPYQSLIKQYLFERVSAETRAGHGV